MADDTQERRLNGWKAIATYLDRDESTAKRWEITRGLPVRRLPGSTNASVYAYPSELTQWLKVPTRTSAPELAPLPAPPIRLHRRILIAAAVVAPILVATAASSQFRTAVEKPRDPTAAEHYFEGMHAVSARTAGGIATAAADFKEVIRIDPGFAPAHVGLSDCYNLAREFGAMPDREAYPLAEQEAKIALALDPRSAGAYRGLAFVTFWFRRDAPTAEAQFRQSLAISPNDPRTHHWYANMLSMLGRYGEAQQEIDAARSLDPESTAIQADRAQILAQVGKIVEARSELARLAALDPRTSGPPEWGAKLALLAHDGPAYVTLAETAARLRSSDDEMALATAAHAGLVANGWPGLLSAMTAETDRQFAAGHLGNYARAQLAAVRGDIPAAAALLRKSLQATDPLAVGILGDAALANVRKAHPEIVNSARAALHMAVAND